VNAGRPAPYALVAWVQRRWHWVQALRPWRAFSHFTNVGGSVLSAGMSYQALFAVFAALYVGFGWLGLWLRGRPDMLSGLVDQINLFAPGLVGPNGVVSLDSLLSPRTIGVTSIIAGASLLWLAMSWFTGTRRSIRIIFGLEVKQYRNAALLKLRDFILALAFGLAMLVSAALTVVSSHLTEAFFDWTGWDPDNWLLGGLGVTVRYAAVFVFDLIILLAIHCLLAEVKVPWGALIRGCLLGALVLFGLKVLGTSLLGGASRNPLLASFAVLIGLLIWFNLVCRTLLLTSSWIAAGQDRRLGLPEAARA